MCDKPPDGSLCVRALWVRCDGAKRIDGRFSLFLSKRLTCIIGTLVDDSKSAQRLLYSWYHRFNGMILLPVRCVRRYCDLMSLSLIHISEPTRRTPISYAVFCLKK